MSNKASIHTPNIFTAPTGRPFLDCLAEAILSGNLPVTDGVDPHPIDIPAMTLLLPTRRATRALQEAFLRAGQGRAMLLPCIKPIAEGDEDMMLMAASMGIETMGAASVGIPPAISEMERRLALTSPRPIATDGKAVFSWSAPVRNQVAEKNDVGGIRKSRAGDSADR